MICTECREERAPTPYEIEFMKGIPATHYSMKGCEACGYTGYRGRTGIYELFRLNDEIREKIHEHASEQELSRMSRALYPTIRADGRAKIQAGITSVEEVMRVTATDS